MRNFEDKQPVEQAIHVTQREWGWIGYTLKRPHRYIAKRVIEWNPQEKCKRSSSQGAYVIPWDFYGESKPPT